MPAAAVSAVAAVAGFALGFVTRKAIEKPKAKIVIKKKSCASKGVVPSVPLMRSNEELKMVLCVNEALKMGKGKIVGVVDRYKAKEQQAFKQWSYFGQAKIALRVQDDTEMNTLAAKASSLGMPTYIVHDAGRTQIPAGSQTVLAIGPAPKSVLDKVTGHLKLL